MLTIPINLDNLTNAERQFIQDQFDIWKKR